MQKKVFKQTFSSSNVTDWIYKNSKIIFGILFLLIFTCVGYIGLSFLQKDDIKVQKRDLSKLDDNKIKDLKFPQLKKEYYYTSVISNKKIFKGSQNKKEFEPLKDISYDFIENFRLKGIMSGKFKRAVIEDTSNGKSYLVGEGDTFLGVRVKDIQKATVILYYKGKIFNLQL